MVMCRIMTQCGTAGNCNLKKSHPPNLTSSKNLKQLTANSSIAEIQNERDKWWGCSHGKGQKN